ncbi:hypothetical protein HDU97_004518 [Phlyctochytrium planicorne]|nr:hypothetical protein HDU97_004518 [Phlyctochytrium planicorne]
MTVEVVDHAIFNQLLEMDDDQTEREFSKGIVLNYFEQAETTFGQMDASLASGDLLNLSRLGHYLKGSASSLGLSRVRASCERIQHYGNMKDETGQHEIPKPDAFRLISEQLPRLRHEHGQAEAYLRKFFGMI